MEVEDAIIKDVLTYKKMEHIMKMKGFVADIKGWTRAFTFIAFDEENEQLFIGHKIPGIKTKMTPMEFEDMNDWIKYFDRI